MEKHWKKLLKSLSLISKFQNSRFLLNLDEKNWNIGAYYLNLILATRAKLSVSQLGSKFLKNIFAKLLHEK